MPNTRPRLGAHMSIGGGLHRAIDRAGEVEATALQLFVKSSRRWSAKPLDPGEVDAFRAGSDERGLTSHTMAHSSYLLNLASPDELLWRRSRDAFFEEMARCARLGIPYLVVHPGSHVGHGEEAGMQRVGRALRQLLERRGADGVTVLLETTAGQGTNLGHTFEQLASMIEFAGGGDRLGVCFDTCHVLAAGYDIRSESGYRDTMKRFDRTVGLKRLKAFHLNDSKHGPGSRRDRHEHIGEGHVGIEAFRLIVNDRRFRALPMVLETPKGEDLAEDRRNLSLLRSLVAAPRR
jgi:deoxyribonuclease-4